MIGKNTPLQEVEEKSRTQIKKETLEITSFGKKLINLNIDQIKSLPTSELIIDNLIQAKSMQKIALKRQVQFIGKIMRKSADIKTLEEKYQSIIGQGQKEVALIHRLEKIREHLLDKDKSKQTLAMVVDNYSSIDIQKLRHLIRNHHKEVANKKPPKSFREIFKILKANAKEED